MAEVREDIRALLSASVGLVSKGEGEGNPSADVLRVRVEIDGGEGSAWTARLRFSGPRGEDLREFGASSCALLSEAVALVIAVSVDPVAVAQRVTLLGSEGGLAEAEVEAPSAQEPEPRVVPAADPEHTDPEQADLEHIESEHAVPRARARAAPGRADGGAPRSNLPTHLGLAALGGGGRGPLDLARAYTGVELSVFQAQWRWTARGLWLPPRTRASARYDGFALATRGCWTPGRGPLAIPLCGGLELARVRGQGVTGTPNPRVSTLTSVAVVVGPGLRWGVHPNVALVLDLELSFNLARGGFRVDERVVAQFSVAGLRALAGVELRLPGVQQHKR